jgi:tetrathionate reductase subunit B
MLVDIRRCIGCQACTISCFQENAMPEGCFRTLVAAYSIRLSEQPGMQPAGTYLLPRLCNHCDKPACVSVCPTGATFKREDGIVVVNNRRCVGCAYCIQACPYDARFINPATNTTDKCTFCVHRIQAGLLPACVETCVGGARIFGDANDQNSQLRQKLRQYQGQIRVLQPQMNTTPNVYYIGLDERFQGKVEGMPALWSPQRSEGASHTGMKGA